MSVQSADYWIERLALIRHPEGGYYREIYRSQAESPAGGIARANCASIYFLLTSGDFSAFHRIGVEEVWHYYGGGSLALYCLNDKGVLAITLLGPDPERGEVLHTVVPARVWVAARVVTETPATGRDFVLVGCTTAPAFEFNDFELGKREDLCADYPEHRDLIEGLTRL